MIDTGITINDHQLDGRVETVDLDDVDSALIKIIDAVISKIYVHNPESKRNARLVEFLKRTSVKDRIGVGEFTSPKEFVRALAKAQKAESEKERKNEDARVQLPFVFIVRDPSVRPDTEYNLTRIPPTAIPDNNGNFFAMMDGSSYLLSYSIYIVGWNDTEVNQIALPLSMWLRHMHRNHKFEFTSALGGVAHKSPAEIINRDSVTFENVSEPREESKLRALNFDLTVSATITRFQYGSEESAKLTAGRGEFMNG